MLGSEIPLLPMKTVASITFRRYIHQLDSVAAHEDLRSCIDSHRVQFVYFRTYLPASKPTTTCVCISLHPGNPLAVNKEHMEPNRNPWLQLSNALICRMIARSQYAVRYSIISSISALMTSTKMHHLKSSLSLNFSHAFQVRQTRVASAYW